MAVKPIAMHEFLEKAGNIYEAIIVSAKRARQIHDEMKLELTQQLETLKALNATPEPEEDSEVMVANPDQLKISMEFEKRTKPTELALAEVKEKKISYRYKEHTDFLTKETPSETPAEE